MCETMVSNLGLSLFNDRGALSLHETDPRQGESLLSVRTAAHKPCVKAPHKSVITTSYACRTKSAFCALQYSFLQPKIYIYLPFLADRERCIHRSLPALALMQMSACELK